MRIPLALLPSEFAKRTGQQPPSYRRFYNAVLDGRLPAERGANGRWSVPDDIPMIAEAMGVTLQYDMASASSDSLAA